MRPWNSTRARLLAGRTPTSTRSQPSSITCSQAPRLRLRRTEAFQCAIPDLRNQRPDLEGALGAGIMQGLEMEVHKRPQSIPEFLALIDAPPLPTQTTPPPPGPQPGNATHATGGGAPLIGASPAARSTPQPVASASTVSEALGCVIVGSCFLLLLFGLLALLAYNHKGESYRPPPDPRRSTPTRVLLDPAGATREIQARYDAMSAAMKAKNPRAYLEVLPRELPGDRREGPFPGPQG